MDKSRRIIEGLIEKNFIKLKRKKIFLIYSKYQIGKNSAAFIPFVVFNWIVLFPISKYYSTNSLKALLAHELSHYELILNMGFLEKITFTFGWLFTKKGKAKFETRSDKYAIKKGFGKGLLELAEKREKKWNKEDLNKRSKRGYLSSKQIKNYRRNQ